MAKLSLAELERIQVQMQFYSSHALRIGWISRPLDSKVNKDSATTRVKDDKGITGPLTVGQIAFWHELGRGNNPKRSMLKQTFIRKREEIGKLQAAAVRGVLAGKLDAEVAMSVVGEGVLSLIKKRMRAGIAPPLTAARKKAKQRAGRGKNTPLINWGQLINSSRYKIVQAQ